MEPETSIPKRRRPFKKVLFWTLAILFIILSITAIYVSRNYNQILADALMKSFNSSVVSDVYELKFEKLRVNIFAGNIKVFNVVMQARKTPLHPYPYINSSFSLKTRKLVLMDVQIMDLIKLGELRLSRIEINKPEIRLWLSEEKNIFLPYKDTTAQKKGKAEPGKRFINTFSLEEFQLANASFHISNTGKKREFSVKELNISLSHLKLEQLSGHDLVSFDAVELAIGEISVRMQQGGFRSFNAENISMNVKALKISSSIDTLIFTYGDFSTGMKNLDLNTSDSVLNLSLKSMDLTYANKSINLTGIVFKPNLSQAEMLRREKYQKAQFSVAVGSLNLVNVNFDTLLYRRKIFVDEMNIDKVDVSLFKDKTKPVDRSKFPQYLGQKIMAIPIPINIKNVKVTQATFANLERKEDRTYAKVNIQRGSLEAKNITNLPSKDMLTLNLSGFVENKAPISLVAVFSYQKPQFSINCKVGRFNLPDLNQLLASYTPAKIKKGTVDEITFSGVVNRTKASGTMKFLYHDLDVDLKVAGKKWQNDIVAFAANTYLSTNNPPSAGLPPKIVHYEAVRDLNKGGFNPIIRSFLSGMKETMIMSKENKKAYKKEKKKWKLKAK